MIFQSFMTLIILEIIALLTFGTGVVFFLQKIPPKEIFLLVFSLLLEFFTFFCYSINVYFSSTNGIDSGTMIFSRLGYFLSQCTIMVITYAFLLIDFKYTYTDIFEILLFSWLGDFNATYNSLTVQSVIRNGSIQSIYTPLGEISIIIFLSSVVFIWTKRFYQISKIYGKLGDATKIFRSLFLFIIVGIFFMSIYIITAIFFHYEGDTTFIMSGFFTIIGTVALYRNNAFLFITDIEFDSVLIIEKKSAILLYSKFFNTTDYQENDPDFISSIISAINISFSNTIKSRKELAEMNFSDKTILIYSGDFVSSICIVSSTNLIVKSISKSIVKKFEKSYGELIQQKIERNDFFGRRKEYQEFDSEIAYIRKFLPL